ncbi:uncharacterized protein [Halyomorpha halys]
MNKLNISLACVEIIGKNIHNLLEKGKPVILKSGKKSYHGFTRLETICQGMKHIFNSDERRNFEHESSHCGTTIVTFEITSSSLIPSNPINTVGRIHLIDTAGTDYGNNPSKSLKCHIDANLTKSELNTICSWYGGRNEPKKTFFFRCSTLALYLGSATTNRFARFLAHIRTSIEDLPTSMSTLLFGTRLKTLHPPLLVQARKRNTELIIRGLQEEIREIKDNIVADKLIKNVFMPETLSKDHMEYILREIQAYCQIEAYEPSILLAKAHPLILVLGFREVYNRDMFEMKDTFEKELESKETDQKLRLKRPSSSLISVHKKLNPSKASTLASSPPRATQQSPSPPQEHKSILDDYSRFDLESDATGEENYARTFSEYLSKSTPMKLRMKIFESDVEESFKTKCDLQSKLTDIKSKINSLRIELKKEEWNTFHKKLENNLFTREGKDFSKSSEQEKIECEIESLVERFNATRSLLHSVHNKYMGASMALNEINTNLEKEYNEYTKLMFSNTLLLPPPEKVCEENPRPSDVLSKQEESIDRVLESERCFVKCQRKPIKKSVNIP